MQMPLTSIGSRAMWIDDAARQSRTEPSCVRFGGRARKSCVRWKRFRPLPYEPFARRLVALEGHRVQATRFTFAHPRRWSSGCGKRRRRGWSVFPFERAAFAMIPAEHTENFQSLAGLSTFSPVANKRGEAQAGAYDDG